MAVGGGLLPLKRDKRGLLVPVNEGPAKLPDTVREPKPEPPTSSGTPSAVPEGVRKMVEVLAAQAQLEKEPPPPAAPLTVI